MDDKLIKNGSVKELEKSLAYYGLQVIGGQDRVLDLIKAERGQRRISIKQCQRFKKKVKELANFHERKNKEG